MLSLILQPLLPSEAGSDRVIHRHQLLLQGESAFLQTPDQNCFNSSALGSSCTPRGCCSISWHLSGITEEMGPRHSLCRPEHWIHIYCCSGLAGNSVQGGLGASPASSHAAAELQGISSACWLPLEEELNFLWPSVGAGQLRFGHSVVFLDSLISSAGSQVWTLTRGVFMVMCI